MTSSVMIGELAWPEYDRRVKDGQTMVLLPIGALEQHGHHMSMNPDVLLPTAMAERVAALPPVLVRMCNEGINLAAGALHQAVSTMDRDQFVLAQGSEDYQEGVRSFMEKRPPVFRGR